MSESGDSETLSSESSNGGFLSVDSDDSQTYDEGRVSTTGCARETRKR